jgi:hypothetical protein
MLGRAASSDDHSQLVRAQDLAVILPCSIGGILVLLCAWQLIRSCRRPHDDLGAPLVSSTAGGPDVRASASSPHMWRVQARDPGDSRAALVRATKELRAASKRGMLTWPKPERLARAIEQARAAGVAPGMIDGAESVLRTEIHRQASVASETDQPVLPPRAACGVQ